MENNSEILNPKSFNIDKHDDFLGKDLIHFSVTHPKLLSRGFGSHEDTKIALKIAINECLEREVFHQSCEILSTRTSSGFAAHNTKDEAKESALCELFERDAFLFSWLCKINAHWFERNEISTEVCNQVGIFESFGFNIKLGRLAISNDRHCCIGILHGSNKKFGSITSTSCHLNLQSALMSVCKELRRGATAVLNRKFSVPKVSHTSAGFHFDYYSNSENTKKIEWMIQGNSSEVQVNKFNINVRDMKAKYLPPWDFHVAYAESRDTQSLYFFEPQFKTINRDRFKKKWRKGFKFNKDLHPLP